MAKGEALYLQISKILKSQIVRGELRYGQHIPSERDLSKTFSVDRKTIRKAILVLVEEGLLTQIQGKGTYISKQKVDYDVNALDNITQMLQRSNVTPSCRVLFQEKRPAGPKYARLLGISESDSIFRLVRLRLGDDEPIALQNTCVPYGIIDDIEGIDFEMHSLYDVLSQHNVKLCRVKETFSFFEFSDPEAKLLNVAPDSVGCLINDVTYDQLQHAVECTTTFINKDKIKIHAEICFD